MLTQCKASRMGNAKSQEDTTLILEADDSKKYELIVESTPFSEGNCKSAYKAKVISPRECDVVVKKSKEKSTMQRDDWELDIKMAKKAEELAKQFNEESRTSRCLHFRQPIPMKVINGPESQFKEGSYVLVEAYLVGEFTKWNTNYDYVNEKDKTSLQAFSHFTYKKTNGKLLICDIQGVKDRNQYSLTDPAIHSDTQEYGSTDLGRRGINAFFKNHICEDHCLKLALQDGDATISSANEPKVTEHHIASQKIENGNDSMNINNENTVLFHGHCGIKEPQHQHKSVSEKTKLNPRAKHQGATNHPSSSKKEEVSIHVDHP